MFTVRNYMSSEKRLANDDMFSAYYSKKYFIRNKRKF